MARGRVDCGSRRKPYGSLVPSVLSNKERAGPVGFLVSRIHQIGAKGKAEVMLSSCSRGYGPSQAHHKWKVRWGREKMRGLD